VLVTSAHRDRTQMENETQTISASAHTADYREGSAAFFEKRTPRFVGQ